MSVRPKQGRPKIGLKAHRVTLTLDVGTYQWLTAQPGTMSAAIRELVREKREKMGEKTFGWRSIEIFEMLPGALQDFAQATRDAGQFVQVVAITGVQPSLAVMVRTLDKFLIQNSEGLLGYRTVSGKSLADEIESEIGMWVNKSAELKPVQV